MQTSLLIYSPDSLLSSEIIAELERDLHCLTRQVGSLDELYLHLSSKGQQLIVLDDSANLLGFNDYVAEELSHDSDVRVIALRAAEKALPTAINAMADDVLVKPVDESALANAIKSLLGDLNPAPAADESHDVVEEPVTVDSAPEAEAAPDEAPAAWVTDAALGQHYLDLFFTEVEAYSAFIYHDGAAWADIGKVEQADLQNLLLLIAGNWNAQNNYDLVKYIKLSNSSRQFCLYVTHIHEDYLLATIFDAFMTMSQMRTQAAQLTRRLEVVLFKEHQSQAPLRQAPAPAAEDASPEALPTLDSVLSGDESPSRLHGAPVTSSWSSSEEPEPQPLSEVTGVEQLAWLTPLLRDAQAQQQKQVEWQKAIRQQKEAEELQKKKLAAQAAVEQANAEKTLPPFGRPKGFRLPWEAGGAPANAESEVNPDFIPGDNLSPQVLGTIPRRGGLSQEVAYTFVLVPKSGLSLMGEIADKLQDYLRTICQAYTWDLKESKIQADCLLWSVVTLTEVSQGKIVRIIREYTSSRLQDEMPELQTSKGVEDLWMPGYLAAKGINTIPKALIDNFIKQSNERRQSRA